MVHFKLHKLGDCAPILLLALDPLASALATTQPSSTRSNALAEGAQSPVRHRLMYLREGVWNRE